MDVGWPHPLHRRRRQGGLSSTRTASPNSAYTSTSTAARSRRLPGGPQLACPNGGRVEPRTRRREALRQACPALRPTALPVSSMRCASRRATRCAGTSPTSLGRPTSVRRPRRPSHPLQRRALPRAKRVGRARVSPCHSVATCPEPCSNAAPAPSVGLRNRRSHVRILTGARTLAALCRPGTCSGNGSESDRPAQRRLGSNRWTPPEDAGDCPVRYPKGRGAGAVTSKRRNVPKPPRDFSPRAKKPQPASLRVRSSGQSR